MRFLILFICLIPFSTTAQTSFDSQKFDPFEKQILSNQSKDSNTENLQDSILKSSIVQKNRNSDNPCNDSLYVELKKIPLDDMSNREYEVFKQKDQACQEFQRTQEANKPAQENAESMKEFSDATKTYYVLAGVATLASVIFLFTI